MRFSLASLLAECCWAGILPGEKRQCPRWRSGRWHQQWPSRRFLFFLAQVVQDPVNGLLVFNAGDDPDRTTAATADFDVYIEYSLESLSPGHGGMALGDCFVIRMDVTPGLAAPLAPPGGGDQSPVFTVGREYPVKSGKVDSWLRHLGCQSGDKIEGFEDHMGGAVSEGSLQFIAHLAGRGE